jgi:hypothetical protein
MRVTVTRTIARQHLHSTVALGANQGERISFLMCSGVTAKSGLGNRKHDRHTGISCRTVKIKPNYLASSDRAVNTLRLGYKNQSVNAV